MNSEVNPEANSEEQSLARQKLIEKRVSLIERGLLKRGQRLSASETAGPTFRPASECPSCQREMGYLPARKAYICVHCQHHPS